MRTASVLMAVCCCLSAAGGLWLEDSICIADTLGGLQAPTCLVYDSVDNTVFVAGHDTLLVLDAATGQRLGRIPFEGRFSELCYNPVSNKVYGICPYDDSVAVIEATTRQVIATIAVGSGPVALAFNATMNRVYCANAGDDEVAVIDGEGDSVITTIDVGESPEALCWNPTRNVVYSSDLVGGAISVIDAAADTVINTIDVEWPGELLYNSDLNKLYVASERDGLVVIDGLADTVITRLSGVEQAEHLSCNSAYSKVYATDGSDDRVMVVDCAADTLLGYIDCYAHGVAYNGRDNRLYVAGVLDVLVADGATDSLLWEAHAGEEVRAVCLADSGRRAFCAADEDCTVGVFDCAGESLLNLVGTDIHPRPSALCFNPTTNKAYCAVEGTNEVMVIDGTDNTVRQVLPVGWGTKALLYSPVGNKVYCANAGGYSVPSDLTVIDGSGDSILRRIETGPEAANSQQMLCQNPAGDRLYEASCGDNTVIVFDVVADTVITRVPLPTRPIAVCYGPAFDYVYAVGSAVVDVIDAEQNIMIAEVDVGSYPVALCYVPVAAKVYTADQNSGTVSVIAGERPERIAQIDVDGSPRALVWDSHDNKLYCSGGDTSVAVIDVNADTLVARVHVVRGPGALCYDSANSCVYCACRYDSSVAVIDCRSDSVIATLHVGASPVALAWNPIEMRTYVADYTGARIYIIRDSLHVGVEGQPQASSHKPLATMVRSVLWLPLRPGAGTSSSPSPSCLLDVGGRKVMDLSPGANDVRGLAPGVYFVRREPSAVSRQPSAITKVIITR